MGVAMAMSLAAPIHARADDSDIVWNSQGQAHQHFEAAPGKLVEYCGNLEAGEKIEWHFEASAPVDFNIHHHVGETVHFAARQELVKASRGVLDAPGDQDYCWMWTNKSSAPASLDVALKRLK
jgi:hypothetical protein